MASEGPRDPTAFATFSETPYDDNDWTTASNGQTSNDQYASITAATFDSPDQSFVLVARAFGFGIPAGATILGILVEYERHFAAGTVSESLVQLTKNGTAGVGDNRSTGVAFPSTDAYLSKGGSADLWGTTWSPSEVNDANFGVRFAMQATQANADGFVDHIRVTVTYRDPVRATAAEVELDYASSVTPVRATAAEIVLEYNAPVRATAAEIDLDYNIPVRVTAAEVVLDYNAAVRATATEVTLDYEPSAQPPSEEAGAGPFLLFLLPEKELFQFPSFKLKGVKRSWAKVRLEAEGTTAEQITWELKSEHKGRLRLKRSFQSRAIQPEGYS